MKHFLRDNETLSSFLLRNASFPEYAVQQIREADVNLEKVRRTQNEKLQEEGMRT